MEGGGGVSCDSRIFLDNERKGRREIRSSFPNSIFPPGRMIFPGGRPRGVKSDMRTKPIESQLRVTAPSECTLMHLRVIVKGIWYASPRQATGGRAHSPRSSRVP